LDSRVRGARIQPFPRTDSHGSTSTRVTQLLAAWSAGDKSALDELIPAVYDELRRLAKNYLSRERPDHTLQTTALVHEAYLRLVDQNAVNWQNRAQFFGIAAQMMRRILINHAKERQAQKRQGICDQEYRWTKP
jgi:RNA polymerase sigma factor (TIGR02999 family)